jgi:hypothetical protein
MGVDAHDHHGLGETFTTMTWFLSIVTVGDWGLGTPSTNQANVQLAARGVTWQLLTDPSKALTSIDTWP